MLTAFFSDIHGNLPALEAAIADAQARGATQIICAGDAVGYGPYPNEVCRVLKKLQIPAVVGNYDRKVIMAVQEGSSAGAEMKPKKRRILLWTIAHLSKAAMRYLSSLPDHLHLEVFDRLRLLVVHGSLLAIEDEIYPSITGRTLKQKLDGSRTDVLVCGHTHIPFVKRINGVLVVNCGSVGHPVDGDPRPSYALVRLNENSSPRGRIVRFDYDRDRITTRLEKSTLPRGLRKDFAEGKKRRFLE